MGIFENAGWPEFLMTLIIGEALILSGNFFYSDETILDAYDKVVIEWQRHGWII